MQRCYSLWLCTACLLRSRSTATICCCYLLHLFIPTMYSYYLLLLLAVTVCCYRCSYVLLVSTHTDLWYARIGNATENNTIFPSVCRKMQRQCGETSSDQQQPQQAPASIHRSFAALRNASSRYYYRLQLCTAVYCYHWLQPSYSVVLLIAPTSYCCDLLQLLLAPI